MIAWEEKHRIPSYALYQFLIDFSNTLKTQLMINTDLFDKYHEKVIKIDDNYMFLDEDFDSAVNQYWYLKLETCKD